MKHGLIKVFEGSGTPRSKVTVERDMDNKVIKDIVNDGGKPHGKTSGRILITEHFTEEIKVWKFDLGTINSEEMITGP